MQGTKALSRVQTVRMQASSGASINLQILENKLSYSKNGVVFPNIVTAHTGATFGVGTQKFGKCVMSVIRTDEFIDFVERELSQSGAVTVAFSNTSGKYVTFSGVIEDVTALMIDYASESIEVQLSGNVTS